jgi:hypothetical protein
LNLIHELINNEYKLGYNEFTILSDYLKELIHNKKDKEQILDNGMNDKNENMKIIDKDNDIEIKEKIVSKILCILLDLIFINLYKKHFKKDLLKLLESIDITIQRISDVSQEIEKIFNYFFIYKKWNSIKKIC